MEIKWIPVFEEIIRKMKHIIIVFDATGNIVLSNKFSNEITKKKLINTNILDLIDIELRDMYEYFEGVAKYKDTNSNVIDIQYSIFSIFDEKSNGNFNVLLGKDITFQESQKNQLKDLLNQKEKFIFDLHHKIKNNLQIVYSLFEVQLYYEIDKLNLNDEYDMKLYKKLNEIIIDIQKRILSISTVHSMLTKSNYNSFGSFVDLSEYIFDMINNTSAVYSFDNKATKINFKGIEYNINSDDCISIGLILNELISNFYKFCMKNVIIGQTIDIYMRKIEHNSEKIRLDIKFSYESIFDVYISKDSENLINGLISQMESEYIIKKSKNKITYTIIYTNKYDRKA
jgi:two-component sensor histidine kinase